MGYVMQHALLLNPFNLNQESSQTVQDRQSAGIAIDTGLLELPVR